MKSLMSCTAHQYCSGDKIEKNGMDGACSTYGERRDTYRVWWRNFRELNHLEDRRRWEDNIKMDLQEVGCGGMDRIELAHDRDSWRAFVYSVMNRQFP
jgi:hypothetical protein